MSTIYNSPIGLTVYQDGTNQFTITGNVSKKHTLVEMESAYDFEELVTSKVKHTGIEFDSEYCQFWAYAKSKDQALQFVKNCENYFEKIKELLTP